MQELLKLSFLREADITTWSRSVVEDFVSTTILDFPSKDNSTVSKPINEKNQRTIFIRCCNIEHTFGIGNASRICTFKRIFTPVNGSHHHHSLALLHLPEPKQYC